MHRTSSATGRKWGLGLLVSGCLAALGLAGDILRGGASANARRADAGEQAAAAAAAQARANAKDTLARTTQAMNAVKAMQASARAAAQAARGPLGADPNNPGQMLPLVPDGLAVGGLDPNPGAGWTGAGLPSQSGGAGGIQVNIKQNTQQAFLNWKTFNVGRNTALNFDQSAGGTKANQWVVFNRINDPSGSPSQILGSITARGQVYIINQNGIIFGGTSQVNVHTLVASSLPINDNLLQRGLLNNPEAQFLFSAIPGTPGFAATTSNVAGGKVGDVTVQAGATIVSPADASGVGGRVALIGANVHNAGAIATPGGQTLLAAGLQVGFEAHNTTDASLRGLDVYVGAVVDPASQLAPYAGTAINSGEIDIPRGNVIMAGKNVHQLGSITSSTSVALNGRIELKASYGAVSNTTYDPINTPDNPPFLNTNTGAVVIGPGSVMNIRPETESAETVARTKLPLQSQINIEGRTVHFAPGSILVAPNAAVTVRAGVWNLVDGSPKRTYFVNSGGQIYVDRDVLISVAGTTDVAVPVTRNLLTVQLRGAELAGSPLQRSSIFRTADGNSPSITVDLRKTGTYNGMYWVGTPLADLTGYLDLIQRTVGELTTAGGSVNFSSGSSVVIQRGAKIDVSGGFINYGSGTIKTTRVLVGSHLLDIADATPDLLYTGIYTGQSVERHVRWGIEKTYAHPLALTGEHFERGYLSGADGGALGIRSSAIALDGDLYGTTIPGIRQREEPPEASALSLSYQGQELTPAPEYPLFSPTPPAIVFGNTQQAAADSFTTDASGNPIALRQDRRDRVFISPDLLSVRGFGHLNVQNPDGSILVPASVSLNTSALGSITLAAARLTVLGSLSSPGGTLDFTVYNISPSVAKAVLRGADPVAPPPNPDRGQFILGSEARLSAAGLLVDDRLNASAPLSLPLVLDGGAVNIRAYSASLEKGSVIDVSGGIAIDAFGQRTYGNGGKILISAGQDTNSGLGAVVGGKLKLEATLLGYSGAVGGFLSIQAPAIQIGGSRLHEDSLLLDPEFFSTGGFSSFTLTGLGIATGTAGEVIPGVYIAPGTRINPVSDTLVAVPHGPNGSGLQTMLVDAPLGVRHPVSLSFVAAGVPSLGQLPVRGDLFFGAGAVIRTDPLASVSFSGATVTVLGSVYAPAGTISINGSKNSFSVFGDDTQALTTVYIGPRSVLSAAGTTLYQPDAYGRRIGMVLPGGSISVGGNIVAAEGAVLDVSGTSGWLDFHPTATDPLLSYRVPPTSGVTSPLYSLITVPVRVDSSGGSISLSGGQMLFSDATLLGRAGGPSALGGSLVVSSGRFYASTVVLQPATDSNLVVTQSGPVIPVPPPTDGSAIGKPVRDANGVAILGRGYFAADTFSAGGFDALTLGGVVQFSGAVTINARASLHVASGGFISANQDVHLSAPYVMLGTPFLPPVRPEDRSGQVPFTNVAPTFGPGRLFVEAQHLDIGTLSLQNIGEAVLSAGRGDIRGNGTLNIAGKLTLRAGQIYPTTLSEFNIIAYDHTVSGSLVQGSITIESGGASALPLSAGGTLNVYASIIEQHGTLRAPFGIINLGWDGTGTTPVDRVTGNALPFPKTTSLTLGAGSITSVSGVDPATGRGIIVPYGISPDGNSWVDPRGIDITGGGLIEKTVNLSAGNITTASGATIDLRGGGDLFAYRWILGNGGPIDILGAPSATWAGSTTYDAGDLVSYEGATYSARIGNSGIAPSVSRYWSRVNQSFAVVPGYGANFSPYAPFNTSTTATNGIAGYGPGYVDTSLQVGDRIFLGGSSTLAAGVYTLLPARYALLPGAVLVTPQEGMPLGTVNLPSGASYVSSYLFNDLNGSRRVPTLASRFEVASAAVVSERAQYEVYTANAFLKESALRLNVATPRLPEDSGYLLFQATQSMNLQGSVLGRSVSGGRGAYVDISSPLDFLITGGAPANVSGVISLNALVLSSFGADSLLIGGRRTRNADGTATVTVVSGNITLDNAGSPLSAPDVILASTKVVTLAPGAEVISTGTLAEGADTLLLSGNGALLRVSQDVDAALVRSNVTTPSAAGMVIGAGALLQGSSLILDSTEFIQLDPTARLIADAYTLDARRISLQLDNAGALQPNPGLVLTQSLLANLLDARSLSLFSYSELDVYGTGVVGSNALGQLSLKAHEIRGFNQGAGTARFEAANIVLGGATGTATTLTPGAGTGTLAFNAGVIHLAANQLLISRYGQVELNAAKGIITDATGSLDVQNGLTFFTPVLTGAAGTTRTITSTGALAFLDNGGAGGVSGGLGATLTATGAGVTATADVLLPSGSLTLRASSGNVTVGGTLDVSGTAHTFYDVTRYTNAGEVRLTADAGNVVLQSQGVVNVAGRAGGGNAGTFAVSAKAGSFVLQGQMLGQGGAGGTQGKFSLDTLALSSTSSLTTSLAAASFTESQIIRVRTGSVVLDGAARASEFRVFADQGGITVTGSVDASGRTGGAIQLASSGDLILANGSVLTVAGETFNSAGQGGAITLESGTQTNGVLGTGVVDVRTGSFLNLSVASKVAGDALTPGSSAYYGQFSGKLHIRAPQNAAFNDVLVSAINGNIVGASSILVEGYRLYDLTVSGGAITTAIQNSIRTNSQAFLGTAGVTTANYTNMTNRLLANNAGLESVFVLAPGAEIINRTGNLTLGATNTTMTSDWDLSGFRFGAKSAPGVLTLRAAGNVTFYNALSDGFTPTLANTNPNWLWLAPLSNQNTLLPTNTQSWSYRITAGADLTSADFRQTQATLGVGVGSVQLGKNGGTMVATGGDSALTSAVIGATLSGGGRGLFQVIRTGTGDIEITSGRSTQLLNQFASIYTAGVGVLDPSLGGTFDQPFLSQFGGTVPLGVAQQNYAVYYSVAGGSVSINARENIERLGASSSRELPNNWLYRRGYVDPATGQFGITGFTSQIGSTSWWIDFSNFFQGVGALGGGNVSLNAGLNVTNVDAVVPTNARVSKGVAATATLLELGGGDVEVLAGNNIDAGVYYVERGHGVLQAGGQITTNATRSPLGIVTSTGANGLANSLSWLPTTLFVGKGGFNVGARGDVLLGPVSNPFLLPQGVGNSYWNKTYFSTYGADSYVNVSSLGGKLTLREVSSISGGASPFLISWISSQHLKTTGSSAASQPWLRLAETLVDPFTTFLTIQPPILRATAFSGDLNLVGDITLAPSATGTLELLANGAVNGLQPAGSANLAGVGLVTTWVASRINVSDSDPRSFPGVFSPYAYQTLVGTSSGTASTTRPNFLVAFNSFFAETGATSGAQAVLQTQQALHTPGLLHANDPDPIRIYAGTGDLSGFTLYSPKATQLFAGRDVSDIALYLQNTSADDGSIVAAGRDIIPYNASSLLRLAATRTGNRVNSSPLTGDVQIGGPGSLEVLAGRNLDLGTGVGNSNGTGVGITTIGNARNPYLPSEGADIFAGAGIGPSFGLSGSDLDFDTFIGAYVKGPSGAAYLAEIGEGDSATSFDQLSDEERHRIALKVFFLVLRDAGRAQTTDAANGYSVGFAAISTLFPTTGTGDILTRGRDIRTRSGGDISIVAPGGALTMANSTIGNPLTPPGIITESGGNISIFTNGDVSLGIGRIFTLRGGSEIIWSSTGDIAAGSAAKTIQAAPPTRVIVDPQSATVQTDLAGLATGGGIGVLATVAGVMPGDVDLIAPVGTVDAGDAGIRATGNLTIAATAVLNASNISVGGSSTGTPAAPVVSAPNIGGLAAASTAAGAGSATAADTMKQNTAAQAAPAEETPSIITVEVVGYGGSEDEEDEETRKRRRAVPPPQ